jgi:hypothetical protein
VKVGKVEQSRHCESLYDHPVFEEIPMTTVELELTTTSAASVNKRAEAGRYKGFFGALFYAMTLNGPARS